MGREKLLKFTGDVSFIDIIKNPKGNIICSMCIMGLGQLLYGQIVKGLAFLLVQVCSITFFAVFGVSAISGLITLGAKEADPWLGIAGDNSVTMLIMGIFSLIVLMFLVMTYVANVKDCHKTQLDVMQGKIPTKIKRELADLVDKKFYKTALVLPIIGVCIFNILPIVFMIIIAFTNYGGEIVPPKLVDWVGFDNFIKIVTLGQFAPTFFKILGWNLIWAFASTALNYFCGLWLALLYNKKCVKGKAIWRAFPILAYATPGFITLLAFKFMFSYGGPINQMIVDSGGAAVGFLGIDAGLMAKFIGLGVNAWISIPVTMLLATGILSNLNNDLYEAARVDGASPARQFRSITLPFVLFSTMPVLLTQFIGNFNNFGIFYFLRGGLYLDGYFLASDTDLLINWLYNLSISNNYYSIGATISLIIFLLTSIISLAVYVSSSSYKEEETFR